MTLSDTGWHSQALQQALDPRWPGFAVEVVQDLDSTNAELMSRARAGHHEPILLVAKHQSAGQGRLGRRWHSGNGSLTFSLGMPLTPKDWSGLSLAVGLSVAQSLHPDIMLKWPNDLWWNKRKLAGILIETTDRGLLSEKASRYVVIGIGLNIGCVAVPGLSIEPAWLNEFLPTMGAEQALACMVGPLMDTLLTFEQQGFAPFQTAYHARDALTQLTVTLSDGVQGVALGVDGVGALQVQTAQGLRRITSTEVSLHSL